MTIAPIDAGRLAKDGKAYRALLTGDADWIVRTAEDLYQLRRHGDRTLAKMSEGAFTAFVNGLVFKHGGVAGGSYRPLMSDLALTEIFEVFARFGMSPAYALETHDSKCVGGSNCEFDFFHFCPSSVCHGTLEE